MFFQTCMEITLVVYITVRGNNQRRIVKEKKKKKKKKKKIRFKTRTENFYELYIINSTLRDQ